MDRTTRQEATDVFSELIATHHAPRDIKADDLPSLSHQISSILSSLREHLGLQVAFISEFLDGQRIFRYVDAEAGLDLIGPGDSGPLDDSYCLRVVEGKLPSLMTDARLHPAALELPITLSLPVGAHLSVPIELKDGAVFGTLCAFSTTPDFSLNDRDVNFMRIIAHFLSMQIEPSHRASRKRLEAYWNIQSIIDTEAYEIHYQPIHSLVHNRITGFEALARFSGVPYRSPDLWFQDAGRVGLQDDMEVAVIRRALRDLPAIPEDLYLSLNVSPGTLLCRELQESLAETDLKRIVLEMTEHVAVSDYSEIKAVVDELRAGGLSIAIDDAGAGYASFRHVLALRPDIIKLDRSLIAGIHDSLSRRTLASALIKFSEVTGAKVVAEGVETEEELETLKKLYVSSAQGYLLGKPAPLATWIP